MNTKKYSVDELIETVREAAYEVRRHFTPGYLESLYRNALCVELAERGLEYKTEYPLPVRYKNNLIGVSRADIIVEDKLIIELKAVRELTLAHELQLVNYLTVTGIDEGLLINYGSEKYRIIHKTRLYKPRQTTNLPPK